MVRSDSEGLDFFGWGLTVSFGLCPLLSESPECSPCPFLGGWLEVVLRIDSGASPEGVDVRSVCCLPNSPGRKLTLRAEFCAHGFSAIPLARR